VCNQARGASRESEPGAVDESAEWVNP